MSILTGPEIERLVELTKYRKSLGVFGPFPGDLPALDIDPYTPAFVGPNSVDVRLADILLVYEDDGEWPRGTHPAGRMMVGRDDYVRPAVGRMQRVLSTREANPVRQLMIPDAGLMLFPGVLYLGATAESVECHGLVPWVDGRSSVGRLGLSVHVTAGRGDDGWAGPLTLELTVVQPLRVFPGDRIAQLTFFTVEGERRPYRGRYAGSTGPVPSRFHEGESAG